MKIGIIANTQKPQALPAVKTFCSILKKRDIRYALDQELAKKINEQTNEPAVSPQAFGECCNIVVAFGGDGTILSAAQYTAEYQIPILGVNIGTLGFLTEVVVYELQEAVDLILENNYSIINRMALQVKLIGNACQDSFLSLNDVVLDRGASSRLIYIDAYVDSRFLTSYRADGLIVSTPTGSTAYSMSAGGPLIVPEMHAFVVTPICPHSVTMKPIVLDATSVIELSVRPEADDIQMNIDGQSKCKLEYPEKVVISKARYDIKWISIGKHDFFDILRTKLNWGVGQPGLSREMPL